MYKVCFCFLIFLTLGPYNSMAGNCKSQLRAISFPYSPDWSSLNTQFRPANPAKKRVLFLSPNERRPIFAKRYFEQSPPGIHVSVGTERGFMSVVMNPMANSLLLLDYSGDIVLFNKINIILLKLSKNRQDYLNLRFAKKQKVWLKVLQNFDLTESEISLLKFSKTFNWWREKHLHMEGGRFFQDPISTAIRDFRKINYLFYDQSFT